MDLRTADECLFDHADGTFLEQIGKLKKTDGRCTSKDGNMPKPHRTGASDSIIAARGDDSHKKNSKMDGPIR